MLRTFLFHVLINTNAKNKSKYLMSKSNLMKSLLKDGVFICNSLESVIYEMQDFDLVNMQTRGKLQEMKEISTCTF